jgi:tetratricopeptide (TPR) repeat protein
VFSTKKASFSWAILLVVLVTRTGAARADKEGARAAYRIGMQHYNLAEYNEALRSFKEAYRQFEDPTFLFNIGQCHRQLGDRQQALTFFRTYLREVPDAANREDVKRLVATLEQQIADEQKSRSVPPQGTLTPAAVAPSPQLTAPTPSPAAAAPQVAAAPTPRPAPVYKKWWLWTAVGVVVAGAVVAGAVVGTQSAPSWSSVPPVGPGAH